MTVFVDASVLVALLALEDGFEQLADRLDSHERRITSAIAIWEATLALSKDGGIMIDAASVDILAFLNARAISIVSVGQREGEIALDAQRRFGKGRHKARLNMGDCFAYACAKANGARLLYKGDDFTHTDLA